MPAQLLHQDVRAEHLLPADLWPQHVLCEDVRTKNVRTQYLRSEDVLPADLWPKHLHARHVCAGMWTEGLL